MAHEELKAAIAASDLDDATKNKLAGIVDERDVLPSEFFGLGISTLKLKVKKGLHIPQAEGPDHVYITGDVVEPAFRDGLALLVKYPDNFERA